MPVEVRNSEDLIIVRPSTLEFKKIGAKLGAEIGVAFGANANTILTEIPEVNLIGVDNNYLGYTYLLKHNLKEYNGRFKLYEMDSLTASSMIEAGTLDFVYIDANHAPVAVALDLELWTPKVRKGGIVAGHDFEKLGRQDGEDVQGAVLRFVTDRKIQLHTASILGEPGENGFNRMDWWFFKE